MTFACFMSIVRRDESKQPLTRYSQLAVSPGRLWKSEVAHQRFRDAQQTPELIGGASIVRQELPPDQLLAAPLRSVGGNKLHQLPHAPRTRKPAMFMTGPTYPTHGCETHTPRRTPGGAIGRSCPVRFPRRCALLVRGHEGTRSQPFAPQCSATKLATR